MIWEGKSSWTLEFKDKVASDMEGSRNGASTNVEVSPGLLWFLDYGLCCAVFMRRKAETLPPQAPWNRMPGPGRSRVGRRLQQVCGA